MCQQDPKGFQILWGLYLRIEVFVMTGLFNIGAIALFTYQKQAQAQENPFSRLPIWMWIIIALIIVAIGVIWTLWEEENKQKRVTPATIPEPASHPRPPAPVAEKPAKPVEEPTPRVVEEPVSIPTSKPTPAPKPDDLRKVSGIGPKIRQVLNEHGIYTFEQLAATDISFLERLMEEQGWRMANFAAWPEQARVLAAEKKNKS